MRRRALVVAVWVAGTVAAMSLALFAVDLVGDRVTDGTSTAAAPGAGGPSTTGGVVVTSTVAPGATTTTTAPGAPPPGPAPSPSTTSGQPAAPAVSAPATVPASPAPSSPPSSTGTFSTEGGSLAAACDGAAVRLLWASPTSGFAAEIHDAGPDRLEVRFRSDDDETRIRVACVDGAPVQEAEGEASEEPDDE